MEKRIAKKSRFRIDKLEDRVAPGAVASATTSTFVSGHQVLSVSLNDSVNGSFGDISGAVAGSASAKVGVF